ncbi:hypothetical protein HaLaN_13464 [Haematococcus lacustris]|uniref:Uncharacterized protein n=1 Tax=Haematococcus lacustris TaxID=44745 RepID=A0A699ZMB8_HAELA|nr:hypothetical protein HaLaN_13464 [Haematococcus lacustris]
MDSSNHAPCVSVVGQCDGATLPVPGGVAGKRRCSLALTGKECHGVRGVSIAAWGQTGQSGQGQLGCSSTGG